MPKTALADMLLEQDSLYAAIDRPEILALPYMQELRDELNAMIKVTKTLAHEQASLEGRRQAVTQELRIAKSQSRDLMVRVRAAVRSHLGHRNEGLVRYRIRPIRRRSRALPEGAGLPPMTLSPSASDPEPVPVPDAVSPGED
jgi:hypothetical protein